VGETPTVCTECLFVDPVSDLAVLGTPDNQDLSELADAYDALMEDAAALAIADAPADSRGWLFSLDGKWFSCRVQRFPRALSISDAAQGIKGGMSGSPVLRAYGAAIGVVAVGKDGPHPLLVSALPGWLLRISESVVPA
jgi:hypothetical protein